MYTFMDSFQKIDCNTTSSLLYSPIIQAGRYTGYSSDDQRVKSIEGQVTEADTSGSDLISSAAPNQYNPNQIFKIGNRFGFFLFFQSQRYNTLDLVSKVSV